MSNVSRTGDPAVPNNAVNPTSFGRSVGSKAQLLDARKAASATEDGELLNVYRLSPIADPDDGRWGNAPWKGDVVVAARMSGDARVVAAGCEMDFMKQDALPAEDVTTGKASAFKSEKLYTSSFSGGGCRGLLRGTVDISALQCKGGGAQ
ncbi:hypothetical protein SB748_26800 [Rhizobium sp. SIMBA_035]